MKKSIAVLGTTKLSIPQKIEHARFIVTSMTGNANFPTPVPALTVITTNVNSLEAASLLAKSGGKDETAAMRAKAVTLELSLKAMCSYVETTANNNFLTAEAVILSAGFNVRRPSPARQNGFRIALGKNPGEIIVRTDAERHSFYMFEMTLTPEVEESWREVYAGSKCSFLVTGLESGNQYFFRVSKMNKNGRSGWSNVRSAYAS